jgi:LysM repeat protein
MATDKPRSTPTKVCPSCGTRVSEASPRCLVCGHQFNAAGKAPAKNAPLVGRAGVAPEVRLSVPIAIGLLALFLLTGGAITYFAFGQGGGASPLAQTTPSVSPTTTLSPTPETPTVTPTMLPSLTPLSYTVQLNDTCGGIAFAFNVQPQDIILANSLNASCALSVNQLILVPQPTFTATPAASATLSELEATIRACETRDHVVQSGETMSLIAVTFGVPMEAILDWNGLTSDVAFEGQRLSIPLCQREFVAGATVTPTIAPPYPAPEPLLPADGEPFASSADTVTLQWASVGTLRGNEYYQITLVDITGGQNRRIIDEVKDTSFIVPTSFRPTDGRTHVYRWFVVPVAQIGVDSDGLPVFITGGAVSETRVFSWSGSGSAPQATPTP